MKSKICRQIGAGILAGCLLYAGFALTGCGTSSAETPPKVADKPIYPIHEMMVPPEVWGR